MRIDETVVVIVAGGRGTRLAPLTDKIPKPMVNVAGKPVLLHIINHFAFFGFRKFVLCLCYLPEFIENYFRDGSQFGVEVSYVYEKEGHPLGSAGAVGLAKGKLTSTFVVAYADILRNLDLLSLWEYHNQTCGLGTIVLHKSLSIPPRSMVKFDHRNSLINQFVEHPTLEQVNKLAVWSNASLYIFNDRVLKYLPSDEFIDFSTDIFPKLIAKNEKIYAYPNIDYLIDIGTVEKLRLSESDIKSGKLRLYDYHKGSI